MAVLESTQEAILSAITSAKPGFPVVAINKIAFTYNSDGSINTILFYDANNNLIFTLTFTWSAGTAVSITRS